MTTLDYRTEDTPERLPNHERQTKLVIQLAHDYAAASVTGASLTARKSIDGDILYTLNSVDNADQFDLLTDNEIEVTINRDDTQYIAPGDWWIGVTVESADDRDKPLNARYRLIGSPPDDGGGQLAANDKSDLQAQITAANAATADQTTRIDNLLASADVTTTGEIRTAGAIATSDSSAVLGVSLVSNYYGRYAIVDAYTSSAELCKIDGAGDLVPLQATFDRAHSADALIVMAGTVLQADQFGIFPDSTTDHKTSLNDLMKLAEREGFSTVYLPGDPAGYYRITRPLYMRDNITVTGDGYATRLYNDNTSRGAGLSSDVTVIMFGAYRATGESFHDMDRFVPMTPPAQGDESVTVSPADAAYFAAGDTLIIKSADIETHGRNLKPNPKCQQINIVKSVDATTGVVDLVYPIHQDYTALAGGRYRTTGPGPHVFVEDETVTGRTSGATAKIGTVSGYSVDQTETTSLNSYALDAVYLYDIVGTFTEDEFIDGASASAQLDSARQPALIAATGYNTAAPDENGETLRVIKRATLRNMRISGQQLGLNRGAFGFGGAVDCALIDLFIESETGFVLNGWSHSLLSNCRIEYARKAIEFAFFSHHSTAINCHAGRVDVPTGGSSSSAIYSAEECYENRFINIVVNAGAAVDEGCVLGQSARNQTVQGCTFIVPNGTKAALIASDGSGHRIEGNRIYCGPGATEAIHLDHTENSIVSNNTIYGDPVAGIVVEDAGGSVISGNILPEITGPAVKVQGTESVNTVVSSNTAPLGTMANELPSPGAAQFVGNIHRGSNAGEGEAEFTSYSATDIDPEAELFSADLTNVREGAIYEMIVSGRFVGTPTLKLIIDSTTAHTITPGATGNFILTGRISFRLSGATEKATVITSTPNGSAVSVGRASIDVDFDSVGVSVTGLATGSDLVLIDHWQLSPIFDQYVR